VTVFILARSDDHREGVFDHVLKTELLEVLGADLAATSALEDVRNPEIARR
jgi:hypothetical protein